MEMDGDGHFGERDPGAAGSSGTGDQGDGRSDSGVRGDGTSGDASSTFSGPAPDGGSFPWHISEIRVDQNTVEPSGAPVASPLFCPKPGPGSSGIYCSVPDPTRAIELAIAFTPGAVLGAIGGALGGPVGGFAGLTLGRVIGGLLGGLPGPRSTGGPTDDMIRSGADVDSSTERRAPEPKQPSGLPRPGTRLF